LLHGFGEDFTIWDNLAKQLTNYTCIIPHLPGTGNSCNEPSLATIPSCSAIVQHILAQEKVTSCTILGHSMGGYIALHFATIYPTYLKALGLIHSTATADTEEKKLARTKSIAFIDANGTAPFLQQSTPNLFAPIFVHNSAAWLKQYITKINYLNQAILTSYLKTMMERQENLSFIQNTNLPILFVIGKEDAAVPLSISMQQCHLPKKSYISILKNVGHMSMYEQPEQLHKIVAEFLKDVNKTLC
jgi:pimeloyl-ACP methyl ester carboxylesterase